MKITLRQTLNNFLLRRRRTRWRVSLTNTCKMIYFLGKRILIFWTGGWCMSAGWEHKVCSCYVMNVCPCKHNLAPDECVLLLCFRPNWCQYCRWHTWLWLSMTHMSGPFFRYLSEKAQSYFWMRKHRVPHWLKLSIKKQKVRIEDRDIEPDVNRTRNLLIWSQTRYHCATDPVVPL